MRKTLFRNATILTLDPKLKHIEKGDMLIEGSTILDVAGLLKLQTQKLLMPLIW